MIKLPTNLADDEALERPLREYIEELAAMNSAQTVTSFQNSDDEHIFAIVLLHGVPETGEALAALDAVAAAWADSRPAPDIEKMRDLLRRSYLMEVDPEWTREYYEIMGEHRFLVKERRGFSWVGPEDVKAYDEADILDEANPPA